MNVLNLLHLHRILIHPIRAMHSPSSQFMAFNHACSGTRLKKSIQRIKLKNNKNQKKNHYKLWHILKKRKKKEAELVFHRKW